MFKACSKHVQKHVRKHRLIERLVEMIWSANLVRKLKFFLLYISLSNKFTSKTSIFLSVILI
jgi:hypothetical protein